MAIHITFYYDSNPSESRSEIWFDEDAFATAAGCVQDELRKGRVFKVEVTPGEKMPESE